jgi:hypothetical protein
LKVFFGRRSGARSTIASTLPYPSFAAISKELTMTKRILVILAVLSLSTSAALAAQRTPHRNAMNSFARMGASPVVPGGVSSGDHAMYIQNLRDSGYDPKSNFNAKGNLVTQ